MMPIVRAYLPLALDELALLGRRRELPVSRAAPLRAYVVTPELERAEPGLDVEDQEYAAFCEAVADADATRRRTGARPVVAAADLDRTWLSEPTVGAGSRCLVALVESLPLTRVASFHVGDVSERSSVDPGAEGDETDATDLLWYDVTELTEVLGLFG